MTQDYLVKFIVKSSEQGPHTYIHANTGWKSHIRNCIYLSRQTRLEAYILAFAKLSFEGKNSAPHLFNVKGKFL